MDTDEEERIIVVNRCVKGEKITNICKNLNRSKGWLSKWVNRLQTGIAKAIIEMITAARYRKGYGMLEPYAVKVASTVLRRERERASNRSYLFDTDAPFFFNLSQLVYFSFSLGTLMYVQFTVSVLYLCVDSFV
ncbi:MAG TPA: helix-turn-helix domain-containing protein [Methanosarcinaceae archaeon]|nr:helix-turn-helix domain-containing protein [Methanosarcinaceae archaeon]